MSEIRFLENCHDCGAKPGQVHAEGCDVERCSVCGDQRMGCGCKGHDRQFARWTGIWPGKAEADWLNVDMNHLDGRSFFIKPTEKVRYITYGGDRVACKGCGATIVWVVTPAGKRMPCDPDGVPHWGTCPNAKEFKR